MHAATEVMAQMGHDLAATRVAGSLDPIGHRILEERLTALTLVEAGSERLTGAIG